MKILSEHKLKEINESVPKLVGEQIRKFRKCKKLSQTELAKLVDKDRQYLYKIEKGLVKPNIVTLSVLALALEVELSELLREVKLSK